MELKRIGSVLNDALGRALKSAEPYQIYRNAVNAIVDGILLKMAAILGDEFPIERIKRYGFFVAVRHG